MLSVHKSQAMSWGPHTGTERFQLGPWKSLYTYGLTSSPRKTECAVFYSQKGKHIGVTIFVEVDTGFEYPFS